MPLPLRRFRIPGRRRARPTDHRAAYVARIRAELAETLPEEDLGDDDLRDALDLYRMGSKPRCEEAEYLDTVEDTLDRIARGR